jgi:hypothetical protein
MLTSFTFFYIFIIISEGSFFYNNEPKLRIAYWTVMFCENIENDPLGHTVTRVTTSKFRTNFLNSDIVVVPKKDK